MTENSGMHRFIGCGLDWVYLRNGFDRHDTPYGPGVSFRKFDELHDAIAREILDDPHRLRGQEVLFLRSRLRLGEEGLDLALGECGGRVEEWESKAGRTRPIPEAADRRLRELVRREKPAGGVGAVRPAPRTAGSGSASADREPRVFALGRSGWAAEPGRAAPGAPAPSAAAQSAPKVESAVRLAAMKSQS